MATAATYTNGEHSHKTICWFYWAKVDGAKLGMDTHMQPDTPSINQQLEKEPFKPVDTWVGPTDLTVPDRLDMSEAAAAPEAAAYIYCAWEQHHWLQPRVRRA
jgi:hypothetical protein